MAVKISMELAGSEVCILVQGAKTPNMGFFIYILPAPMCCYSLYICAVNMLPVLFKFFSSQVKNKPCDGFETCVYS
jgi:hypothetical protein